MWTSTSPCASFSGSACALSTYSTSSGGPCALKRIALVVSGGSGVDVASVASIPPRFDRKRSSAV